MHVPVPRRWFRQLSPVGQRIVASVHRARAAAPGFARHISGPPPGYLPVLDRDIAHARLLTVVPRRADAAANRRAICAALVEYMGRWGTTGDGWIGVGHQRLADRASEIAGRRISRTCVAGHIRAMVTAGVLHVAMRGCSKLINGTGRDWCPIYVVIDHDPDHGEIDPAGWAALAALRAGPVVGPETRTHTKGAVDLLEVGDGLGHLGGKKTRRNRPQRIDRVEKFVPRTHRERALAGTWLAGQLQLDPVVHAHTLAKACAVFYAAGWTPEAVYWATRTTPDGTAHPPRIIDADRPARVLNWRLSHWCGPRRQPMAPPTPAARPARGRPLTPASTAEDPPARDPRRIYDNDGHSNHAEGEIAAARAAIRAAVARFRAPQPKFA